MNTIDRPRRTLTVRDPAIELLLNKYPGERPDDLRDFTTDVIRSVRRWSNARRRRRNVGLFGATLDRAEADAALRGALSKEASQ